jgi:hypothetical protein
MVRLPSVPNSESAEMSLSFSLLLLRIEFNVIQRKSKQGEVIKFSQFRECRDVLELLIVMTRIGVECDTGRG